MRQKEGFKLRDIGGENVIIAMGVANVNFGRLITLNNTAAYLWRAVEGCEFDAPMLAELLTKAYEVDANRALSDSESIVEKWLAEGLLTQ